MPSTARFGSRGVRTRNRYAPAVLTVRNDPLRRARRRVLFFVLLEGGVGAVIALGALVGGGLTATVGGLENQPGDPRVDAIHLFEVAGIGATVTALVGFCGLRLWRGGSSAVMVVTSAQVLVAAAAASLAPALVVIPGLVLVTGVDAALVERAIARRSASPDGLGGVGRSVATVAVVVGPCVAGLGKGWLAYPGTWIGLAWLSALALVFVHRIR